MLLSGGRWEASKSCHGLTGRHSGRCNSNRLGPQRTRRPPDNQSPTPRRSLLCNLDSTRFSRGVRNLRVRLYRWNTFYIQERALTFPGMRKIQIRNGDSYLKKYFMVCSSEQSFHAPIEELAFDSKHRRVASASCEGIKVYELDDQGDEDQTLLGRGLSLG